MPLSSAKFLDEIRAMVERKHTRDHPLIGKIQRGEVSRGALRGFIKQFYLFFPKPFPKPIAAMYARCPEDPELERMWLDNVIEEGTGELTGTDSHKGLYIRFAEAAGISRKELDATEPLPETWAFLTWRELLISQRSWLELYAAQGFCLEGTASARMARIVEGLTKHYGFAPNGDDVRYWTLHMNVDEQHMKVGPLAVERYATTDDLQAQVRDAVQKTLDIFWLAYDGIHRAFVDQDPVYARWR